MKEVPREEKCECCGEVMAPNHQCESEEESDEEDEEEQVAPKRPCNFCGMSFEAPADLNSHLKDIHNRIIF